MTNATKCPKANTQAVTGKAYRACEVCRVVTFIVPTGGETACEREARYDALAEAEWANRRDDS